MHPLFELTVPSHRRIINLIRLHNGISGAELARLSGMQPSSLVYILRHLSALQLISQTKLYESTSRGGKHSLLWKIHPATGYLLGIEYRGDRARYVFTSLDGLIQAGDSLTLNHSPKRPEEGILHTIEWARGCRRVVWHAARPLGIAQKITRNRPC